MRIQHFQPTYERMTGLEIFASVIFIKMWPGAINWIGWVGSLSHFVVPSLDGIRLNRVMMGRGPCVLCWNNIFSCCCFCFLFFYAKRKGNFCPQALHVYCAPSSTRSRHFPFGHAIYAMRDANYIHSAYTYECRYSLNYPIFYAYGDLPLLLTAYYLFITFYYRGQFEMAMKEDGDARWSNEITLKDLAFVVDT